jgi:hypothetical protein
MGSAMLLRKLTIAMKAKTPYLLLLFLALGLFGNAQNPFEDNDIEARPLSLGKGNTVLWWKWMHLSNNVVELDDIPREARNAEGW